MSRKAKSTSNPTLEASKDSPRSWKNAARLVGLALVSFGIAFGARLLLRPAPSAPPGMVWIPGEEFVMGTEGPKAAANEQPAHRVALEGFWIDANEVTNKSFRTFVEETGYVTTAERKPDWEELKKGLPPGTPRPPEETLVPGSLVFSPPDSQVSLDDPSAWWQWVPGASWKHPEGPKSNLDGRENHPVVQVSWDDAVAYARWAGKRLPTEAEWECAARAGIAGRRFTWGNEPPSDKSRLANIWQGTFPNKNTKSDGYERTAPVRSFPPNERGLYDMAGNVWEWCSDLYRADAYSLEAGGVVKNPIGPSTSWDPMEPLAVKRVTRGGSFLCHVDYCESYRPAARRGTAPDTGMSHLGFRCVKSAK